MKEIRLPFSWYTLIHDFNAQTIIPYDILAHREFLIKRFKKQFETKEAFAEALHRDLKYQYWSRCEYEMLLYVENERVYLMPWVGKLRVDKLDITDNPLLNWPAFAKHLLRDRGWPDRTNNRTYVKFDIYDQIMFRFDELVDFCWSYQHKYQRHKKETT